MTTPEPVTANTVLPARRDDIELHTADGLTLVGELALPRDREPVATLVTFHPLPTHGGFMDSHIYRKAALRLPAMADLAVLRFNTRGTTSPRGTSGGSFGNGQAEVDDVAAAMAFVRRHGLPNPWMVGWSFGTELIVKYGRDYPEATGYIMLSPPLRRASQAELEAWADETRPTVMLVPEFDDFLRPAEAAERIRDVPGVRMIAIEGGRHLWVGETQTSRVLTEIVRLVNPDALPLPKTWPPAAGE